jgi:hypothetical protein
METIVEEKIEIAPELLAQSVVQVEKQVIVHCIIYGDKNVIYTVRVWPSIYLIPKGSNHRCRLLHHFNITFYPEWQPIKPNETLRFTLVFEGLPADCTHFDLMEIIPEPGGFEVINIRRNNEDVYTLVI